MTEATKEIAITMSAVIATRKSLADLLVEESQYMDNMQISKVDALQERKLKLTSLLERYTRYLAKNRILLENMTPEEKTEMKAVNDYFQKAIRVNYEKLLVARAVNKAIVTCVTGQLVKGNSNQIYNRTGVMYNTYRAPVSMTLNRVI